MRITFENYVEKLSHQNDNPIELSSSHIERVAQYLNILAFLLNAKPIFCEISENNYGLMKVLVKLLTI